MKRAVLLNNLGTPDSPSPQNVGKYLKEFLMDPSVIQLPYIFRWLLVNLIIVPRRRFASAKNYQKVWSKRGSPLLYHSVDLKDKLQNLMPETLVEICMRYGRPSIEQKVFKLAEKEVEQIDFIPLYPQYSVATTLSSIKEFKKVMTKYPTVKYRIKEYFYHRQEYIDASAKHYKKHLEGKSFEHYIFSFHGLPKKDVQKEGPNHCLEKKDCCFIDCEASKKCYISQCKKTALNIAKDLGLKESEFTIAFQSRLGPTEWVKPYTDKTVESLAESGYKSIALFSPSFVADCLETLEELNMGLKETFSEKGGRDFYVLPCLNSEDQWAEALAEIINNEAYSFKS